MATFIIVEGPDCVGKGFFIEQLKSYMARPLNKPFSEEGLEERDPEMFALLKDLRWSIQSGSPTQNGLSPEEAEQALKEIVTFKPITQPMSLAVANIADATPENKEFTRKIHAGELNQDEIADEYLQVIYDHFNYAKLLAETHDIVVMDRSLPSYYAYQISSMGYPQKLPYWEQLHELMTNEIDFIVIHLDAPVQVLAERKAKKKGVSVLDDIFFEKIEKIKAGYTECYARGYFPRLATIDATVGGEHPYDEVFKQLMVKLITSTADV